MHVGPNFFTLTWFLVFMPVCFSQTNEATKPTSRFQEISNSIDVGFEREGLAFRPRAVELYTELLTLHETESGEIRAKLLNRKAILLRKLGRLEEARQDYRQALNIYRILNSKEGMGRIHNNLAVLQMDLGLFSEALKNLHAAGEYRADQPDEKKIALFGNQGYAQAQLGNFALARDNYVRAKILAEKTGDRELETHHSLEEAWILHLLGKCDQAVSQLKDAVQVAKTLANLELETAALDHMGNCLKESGQFEAAEKCYQAQLAIMNANPALKARISGPVWGHLAENYLAQGRWDVGAQALDKAEQAYAARADWAGTVHLRYLRGLLLQGRNQPLKAIGFHLESIDLLARHRARIVHLRGRRGFGEWRRRYVDVLFELYLSLHPLHPEKRFHEKALALVEQHRARSFLEEMAVVSGSNAQNMEKLILEIERLQWLPNPDHAALRAKLAELDQLQAMGKQHVPRPRSLTSAEIRHHLKDQNTLLLTYKLGPEKSRLWMTDQHQTKLYNLPAQGIISDVARKYIELLSTTPGGFGYKQAQIQGEWLSDVLLRPVADHIAGKRLLLVTDGILQSVPFVALTIPGRNHPLVMEHEVINLPSFSHFVYAQQVFPGSASGFLAAVGDPVYNFRDDRLKGVVMSDEARKLRQKSRLVQTAVECKSIFDLAEQRRPGANLLALGFDSSRPLLDKLTQYRYLHFATHAYWDVKVPDLPAVVLSIYDAGGNPADGYVSLESLRQLPLRADHMVLSGCMTAAGRDYQGEGAVGLPQLLLSGKTRSCVATMWPVPDVHVTANFMTAYYQRIFDHNMRPAAALRAVQIDQIKAGQPAYFWAGWAFFGDWRL